MSESSWPHGWQPTRLLRPWDLPGKSTGVGCHCLLWVVWKSFHVPSLSNGHYKLFILLKLSNCSLCFYWVCLYMWVCRLKQMAKDYPVCQDLRCYHVTQWSSLFFFAFQFSSVSQSCPTLCYPMNRSIPGLSVHHQLPEPTQTHIHRVSDAIQSSHLLSSPSPPAPKPSQHQSLFN